MGDWCVVIVGLGNQGKKRQAVVLGAGDTIAAAVDPLNSIWKDVRSVPLSHYDAALVCVPAQEASSIVEYLVANKKHVLVEKPFEPAVPAHDSVLYVAYNHRFEPHVARLKRLIDSGVLGKLYHCRMFYGNGTAENVRGSWRDEWDNSVESEIGSHLVDLNDFLFVGHRIATRISGKRWENRKIDHAIIDFSGEPTIQHEVTYLSWKNAFTIDLLAERGSAHVDGLTKWGASMFTHRVRQSPPGVPTETRHVLVEPDGTWMAEYAYFKKLCGAG